MRSLLLKNIDKTQNNATSKVIIIFTTLSVMFSVGVITGIKMSTSEFKKGGVMDK